MKAGLQLNVVLLSAATLGGAGCGPDLGAPPPVFATVPTPFVELVGQVGGQWAGPATLQRVEGTFTDLGECVQQDVNQRLFTTSIADDIVLAMSQTNSDVTARLTAPGTGLSCSYRGKVAASDVILDAATCDAPLVVVRCTEDRVRDLRIIGSTATARLEPAIAGQPRTISGTVTNTYNVFHSGESIGVGGVVVKYTYIAQRQ